jgi:glycosyltransferase involved in cell wall biosynthesis
VFTLASLVEAFGRVMVEAMSHGLPCLAHDGPVQRYVLGPHGGFGDLRVRGELTRLLSGEHERSADAAHERNRFVHERFSWDSLAPRYAELLRRCAARP